MAVASAAVLTVACSQNSLASASSSPFKSSPHVFSQSLGVCNPTSTCNRQQKTGRDLSLRCSMQTNTNVFVEESTTSFPCLYTVLGVHQNVSFLEIKTAYRQMARKYHPDVCAPGKKEESTRMFLQVRDAYDRLSDPERRAEYDYELVCHQTRSGKALGFSYNRSPRRSKRDSSSDYWRSQWEQQLDILDERKKMDRFSESWGARMRRAAASRKT